MLEPWRETWLAGYLNSKQGDKTMKTQSEIKAKMNLRKKELQEMVETYHSLMQRFETKNSSGYETSKRQWLRAKAKLSEVIELTDFLLG